jgi:hypothetical protein
VYYPQRNPDPPLVACSTCGTAIEKRAACPQLVPDPPAAVQVLAFVDEEVQKAPMGLPQYIVDGHPSLVKMMQRYAIVNRCLLPLQEWLLDVLEEPEILQSVRVYAALRKSKPHSSWACAWRLRQALLGPLLPLALSPNCTLGVIPVALAYVGLAFVIFLDATSYTKAYLYAEYLAAAKVATVFFAVLSTFVWARLITLEPGYVRPPADWSQEALPEDRSAVAMRRAGRCPTCFVKRPKRAGHCKACGLCVERYDHHCHVLGHCIGKRNFGIFCAYVFTITVALTCSLPWTASMVGLWPVDADAPTWDSARRSVFLSTTRAIAAVLLVIIVVTFTVFTWGMTCGVAASLCTGRTTREGEVKKRRNWWKQQKSVVEEYYRDLPTSDISTEVLAAARGLENESDLDEVDDGRGCGRRWYSELTGSSRPRSTVFLDRYAAEV